MGLEHTSWFKDLSLDLGLDLYYYYIYMCIVRQSVKILYIFLKSFSLKKSFSLQRFSNPKKYFLLKSTQNLLKRTENHFNIFSFQINSESSKKYRFFVESSLKYTFFGSIFQKFGKHRH